MRRARLDRLAIGLMPAAALAVHELRYLLAYGGKADHQLAEQGHAYLSSLAPWIVAGVALALGGFLVRLARAWSGRQTGERDGCYRLLVLWLASTAALLAIYASQELLEGLFSTGHPSGLVGAFGNGGLWAIPSALAVGALIAVALRGQEAAVAYVARIRVRLRLPRRRRTTRPRPSSVLRAPVTPLASSAAGRGPPELAPSQP